MGTTPTEQAKFQAPDDASFLNTPQGYQPRPRPAGPTPKRKLIRKGKADATTDQRSPYHRDKLDEIC